MKIGIIYYTLSRHTLALSRFLQQSFEQVGHSVTLARLETACYQIRAQKAELKTIPLIDGYDLLILACPVHGGRMAPPMQAFLDKTPTLKDQIVACLVTQVFPHWLGGDQTLADMKSVCEAKGANVVATGSVSWYSFARRRQIQHVKDTIQSILKG
jgi:multimeric flavodoxin WrbA